VVDTTGAGDAFNAGLMNALRVGETWSDAVRAASRLASVVVSRPSDDRYPTRAQLLASA
jgi:sugar/nucleoside kinase (ribokinase family)